MILLRKLFYTKILDFFLNGPSLKNKFIKLNKKKNVPSFKCDY